MRRAASFPESTPGAGPSSATIAISPHPYPSHPHRQQQHHDPIPPQQRHPQFRNLGPSGLQPPHQQHVAYDPLAAQAAGGVSYTPSPDSAGPSPFTHFHTFSLQEGGSGSARDRAPSKPLDGPPAPRRQSSSSRVGAETVSGGEIAEDEGDMGDAGEEYLESAGLPPSEISNVGEVAAAASWVQRGPGMAGPGQHPYGGPQQPQQPIPMQGHPHQQHQHPHQQQQPTHREQHPHPQHPHQQHPHQQHPHQPQYLHQQHHHLQQHSHQQQHPGMPPMTREDRSSSWPGH